MNKNRDDFSQQVKVCLPSVRDIDAQTQIAKNQLLGAQEGGSKSISIGIAAHITAAAPGGPRYNAAMTPEERSSIDNGFGCVQTVPL